MADPKVAEQPDFKAGVSAHSLADGGMRIGRVGDDEVLLVRAGEEFFAVSPQCTHYHGALADGLVVGDTVRCPLHHACFNLRTGAAVRAPAFSPLSCWRVERRGDLVCVREKLDPPQAATRVSTPGQEIPDSVVIIGGGAAGFAAADTLRREGYDGQVTIISADDSAPYDRPNLSKDYLSGEMRDDWMPLQADDDYRARRIELLLKTRVASIDVKNRRFVLDGGTAREFGALLLATGADPIHLPIRGAETPRVHYLRTFNDGRLLVEQAKSAKRVVIVGASFIGLEVAAAFRLRGINVDVVAPESVPLERVMGREVGQFVRQLHESHGVTFHLGESVVRIEDRTVTLTGGSTLDADFVVMGVGVRPATSLAEQAGLTMDRGIVVNEYLETSAPGIFAAGDVARWPDPHTGERIRVEHWVVAERQGQVAARNILGRRERFDAVPFFWSQHYDTTINYVGHAEKWDVEQFDGTLADGRCTVVYRLGARRVAVATISRDRDSLHAEAAMEYDRV